MATATVQIHSTKMIHHIISFALLFFIWRLSSSFQKGKELLPRTIFGKSFSLPTKASKERPQISHNQDGSELSIGIACARWNSDIVTGLYEGVIESLKACNVKNIQRTWAPGSFELPFTAKMLADYGSYDAIICIGCLVKGETMHFEHIAEAVSNGVMKVQLDSGVPCLFGVLTVMNLQQAIVRSTGEANEGLSWGNSAVEMGLLRKRFQNYKTGDNCKEC